jgi:hypothetical protein
MIYRRALGRLANMNRSIVDDGDTVIARLSRDTI